MPPSRPIPPILYPRHRLYATGSFRPAFYKRQRLGAPAGRETASRGWRRGQNRQPHLRRTTVLGTARGGGVQGQSPCRTARGGFGSRKGRRSQGAALLEGIKNAPGNPIQDIPGRKSLNRTLDHFKFAFRVSSCLFSSAGSLSPNFWKNSEMPSASAVHRSLSMARMDFKVSRL